MRGLKMKIYLIAVLGMLSVLITLPVQADESTKDAKFAKPNFSHVTRAEASSTKYSDPTLVDNDQEQRGVDCFYEDNADDPFCKNLKQRENRQELAHQIIQPAAVFK
jgi:hypothetical protein